MGNLSVGALEFRDELERRTRSREIAFGIERLRSPNAFSQQQPSFSQHVLQQPSVEEADERANHFVVRTPFLYAEAQLDRQLLLAGTVWHHLAALDGMLRIRLKKIELLNRDAALPSIQLFL